MELSISHSDIAMPTRLTKAYSGDSGSSGKLSQLPLKHGSVIVPHSQTVCNGKGLSHHKRKRMCTSLDLASDIRGYIKHGSDSEPLGLIGHNGLAPRKRSRSSMLVLGTAGSDLQAQSDEDDPLKPMVVSTRFGNSNYEKYSAILVHERNTFSALLSRDVRNLPLFSQTETCSFFITKGTTVSKPTHHGGVKIRPLCSSTDSEVDTQTPEDDISCEPSNAAALSYKINDSFGELSPSLVKVSQHETLDTASVDPKARGKLGNTISSMESVEASSSRTQSLEAEHLLPCTEASSRWVKRLKPSSSEVGESSSHPHADESSSRKDAVLQSSWIQRWCKDHSRKGAVVKCEPHSSKLDDADKKQFPSIAAMALMGKSMSGFRPCKLTKRGPLVVWNTDDHT